MGLGLRERSRRAVWSALLPLALGHAPATAGAVAVGLVLGQFVPVAAMKWAAAVVQEKLGLRLLRKAGINLDLPWGGALVATGVLTAVVGG